MAIDKISGQAFSSVQSVSAIAKGSISSMSSQAASSGGPTWISTIWDFNTQPTQTSTGWVPDAAYAADGWVNGNTSVNGISFRSGTTSQGLNCDYFTSPSGGTGPNGGMTSYTDGTIDSATSQRYLYKEASSGRSGWDHVGRTPGFNFSTLMSSTSNNLRMRFGYQAYGSNITPTIYNIYVDTATTSNTSSASLVATLASSGNTMASGDIAYTIVDIDLNAYRTVNATHYFWINIPVMTGFRADVAIDSVYFEEY